MALWQILLAASALALGGAGFLYFKEWKATQGAQRNEVPMPTMSLLGNSSREYNAKEVRIPESKAPVHLIRQVGNSYQELPLTSNTMPEVSLPETSFADKPVEKTEQVPPKKKDDDWAPIDFFGEEKQ